MAQAQESLSRYAGDATLLDALRQAHAGGDPALPSGYPVSRFRLVLAAVRRAGPEGLARPAQRLIDGGTAAQRDAIERFLGRPTGTGATSAAEAMLVRLFLHPLAEAAATRLLAERASEGRDALGHLPEGTRDLGACPLCGAAPQVGYLAGVEGSEGALFLGCSLCGCAWRHTRMRCYACGATRGLSSFRPEGYRAVRLDACDGCRSYLKVFDLRVDGRVVPPVDDIATVRMDLWASDQGLHKPSIHLAGV